MEKVQNGLNILNVLPLIFVVIYTTLISPNYNIPLWVEILILISFILFSGFLFYKNYKSGQVSKKAMTTIAILTLGTALVATAGSYFMFR